ncbi:peptidyl-prolyl cis-trans isomerase [Bradyrhizobium cajani]|uniref:Parvulin-like PPIase n=2 Tax=Bradyrhizobium cajani TaxID=1928661 RepID=A0A844SY78_9BRAD|nr:peptidylprolyl isomerase [Bradyrhizobium cajani]MCP3368059.1 peptidylprolyl isomerase [Bradyrhizobium cajani]MVT71888.1 peptidyl-prolyl cis-trans isomerase [Bradyrhizobium cajani]
MSMPATSDEVQSLPTSRDRRSDSSIESTRGGTQPSHSIGSLLMRVSREPLLHFTLLGAMIFGADAVLHPPAKEEKVITVTKAMRQSFIDNFDEDKLRTPSDEQLSKMIESWVASEILYREGKSLGVDRGDEMIRDRIAFKMQLMIFDQIRVPQPTEEQLGQWFAENHVRFDEPERVSFYITPPTDQATAQRQFEDIVQEHESEELQQQTRAVLARPVASLAASFGEDFRDTLLAMQQGQWKVLRSKDGWHVARVDSRHQGKLASLDQVRDEAARIWHTEETRKLAWEAVKRLKTSYQVRYEQ